MGLTLIDALTYDATIAVSDKWLVWKRFLMLYFFRDLITSLKRHIVFHNSFESPKKSLLTVGWPYSSQKRCFCCDVLVGLHFIQFRIHCAMKISVTIISEKLISSHLPPSIFRSYICIRKIGKSCLHWSCITTKTKKKDSPACTMSFLHS